ncbi:MAG: hypothetical protein WC497_02715 [Patescibacteria group bacterium]
MRIFSKVSQLTLIIGFGIIALLAVGYIVYQDQFGRFDIQHVRSDPNFTYSDALSCHVVYSTFHDVGEHFLKYYANTNLQLIGLTTDSPKMIVDGFEQPLRKIEEGTYTSTFYTEPVSKDVDDPSVEMIQVQKIDGTFVRSFVGLGQYFGPREVFYPDGFQLVIAQKGRCE